MNDFQNVLHNVFPFDICGTFWKVILSYINGKNIFAIAAYTKEVSEDKCWSMNTLYLLRLR